MICTVYHIPAHCAGGTQVDVTGLDEKEARQHAIECVKGLLPRHEQARFKALATYLPAC